MDTLERFLRNNDATLVIPLLAKLKLPTAAYLSAHESEEWNVYLPDDVAIQYLADHIDVTVETLLKSGKFIQMLQYGVTMNHNGKFPIGVDNEGRETIDGLTVLYHRPIGGMIYKIIDGVLGKGNDIKEITIVNTWIGLPNDVFANLIRTNRITGKELLSFCSSNRALSAKCDANDGLLFRQLLIDEFRIRLPPNVDARARYTAIFRDTEALKTLALKTGPGTPTISWNGMTMGTDSYIENPTDIYDLLYAENDNTASEFEVSLIGSIDLSSDHPMVMRKKRELNAIYRPASMAIGAFGFMRYEYEDRNVPRNITAWSKMTGETEIELAEQYVEPVTFERDFSYEEKLEILKRWTENFAKYLRVMFKTTTDQDIRNMIEARLEAIRRKCAVFLEYSDLDELEEEGVLLTQESIDRITLTEAEVNLVLKIHHAVLKGTIDASYVFNTDPDVILQIAIHLE